MSEVSIRKGKADDLHAVSELLRASWAITYKDNYTPEKLRQIWLNWHNVEVLGRQLTADDGVFLVAETAGKIVGHAWALYKADRVAWLSKLYILPDAQRAGVGAKLLQTVLKFFADAPVVYLEVEENNVNALAFYRKHGFKVVGKTSCGEGCDGIPALLMERRTHND